MKNYYYNPKTQDLMIFDSTTNEIDVLEVLRGIRVITSSEIQNPVDDDGHKTRPRFSDEKVGPKPGRKRGPKPASAKTRKPRVIVCKNCGEKGHFTKTCKNAPVQSPPPPASKDLPDEEVTKIAREERQGDTP
jgi:hypothetical protein